MLQRKVFGIGLSRTGTSSLTDALRLFGLKTAHMPLSVIDIVDTHPVVDREKVQSFDAVTDTVAACVYRELAELFPDALFILTTRDPEGWIASMQRLHKTNLLALLSPKIRSIRRELYGTLWFNDRESLLQAFDEHHASVGKYFETKPERLLVLDLAEDDKMQKIAAFLDLPLPASAEYPHRNRGFTTSVENLRDIVRHLA